MLRYDSRNTLNISNIDLCNYYRKETYQDSNYMTLDITCENI